MSRSFSRPLALDDFDRKILAEIQKDAELGLSEMSARVNLSPSQCSRRLQRLRDAGYIARSVAILNPVALDLGVSAIILIKLSSHSTDNETRFLTRIQDLDEVIACHYVTGDLDFVLHVVTRDLETFEQLLRQHLHKSADIVDCRSNIILRTAKQTTQLPLRYL